MRRKNKNIILITVAITLISLCLIIHKEIKNIEELSQNNNSIYTTQEDFTSIPDNFFNNYFKKEENTTKPNENKKRTMEIIFIILTIITSQIILYLLFSGFNYFSFQETFKPWSKGIVYILLSLAIIAFIITKYNPLPKENNIIPSQNNKEENKKEEIDGVEVTSRDIELSNYDTNIILTRSGNYTLKGDFKHTIILECTGDITLILNTVDITTENMPAILNRGVGKLKIETIKDTENNLINSGTSTYDSLIYSTGPLDIKGEGKLNITSLDESAINVVANDLSIHSGNLYITAKKHGLTTSSKIGLIDITGGTIYIKSAKANIKSSQELTINGGDIYLAGTEEDSPIDTVNGYTINKGRLVAISKDIYATPKNTSKNYTICLKLKDIIKKDTQITLLEENKHILSFISYDDFNTIIISTPKITKNNYSLYKEGTPLDFTNQYFLEEIDYIKGTSIYDNIEVKSKVTAIR